MANANGKRNRRRARVAIPVLGLLGALLIYRSDIWLKVMYRVEYEEYPTIEWVRSRTLTNRWNEDQFILQAYYVETGFMKEEYRSGTSPTSWTREGRCIRKENMVTGEVIGVDQEKPSAPWWVYEDSLYE